MKCENCGKTDKRTKKGIALCQSCTDKLIEDSRQPLKQTTTGNRVLDNAIAEYNYSRRDTGNYTKQIVYVTLCKNGKYYIDQHCSLDKIVQKAMARHAVQVYQVQPEIVSVYIASIN